MKRSAFGTALGLAALAAVLARLPALRAPFFADDWLFLDLVRSRSLVAALLAPDPIGNFFRPLGRAFWFWSLGHATGESAPAFHAANLALLVACVIMVALLGRRLAGERAGAIAAAVLALSYAADVPVFWASGSQDLLAATLALACLLAFVAGRRWLAALLLLLALLGKEVVVLAPVPAALLARRAGESWRTSARRAWPLALAVGLWAVALAAFMASHPRPAGASFTLLGPLDALAGVVRTLFGLEWATGGAPLVPFAMPNALEGLALLAAAAAAWWLAPPARPAASPPARRRANARERGAAPSRGGAGAAPAERAPAAHATRASREALLGALAWVVVAALPVAIVTSIWSAYYYLFAICGASLLLGLLLARSSRLAAASVVVVLGIASLEASQLEEFATAPGALTAQSHVNRFYLMRGMNVISRGIADLRELHPTMPHRSTMFVAGLPSFAAFQVADGPLLRGVYRDSSLRSYFLSQLTPARVQRGPAWFIEFDPHTGHLIDETDDSTLYVRVALAQLLNEKPEVARVALQLAEQKHDTLRVTHYLAAFVALSMGDTAAARAGLAAAHCAWTGGGEAALAAIRARAASGDTTGAIAMLDGAITSHALDVRFHALLATLQIARPDSREKAPLEAYITRVLAPDDPLSWRLWAFALFYQNRIDEADRALQRYAAMAPQAAARDIAGQQLGQYIKRMRPGGDIAQRAMRSEAER